MDYSNADHSLKLVKCCVKEGRYVEGLAHMCVIVTRHPRFKVAVKRDFVAILNYCTEGLKAENRWLDVLHCYEKALQVFGDCEEIHYQLGAFLLKSGHTLKSVECFQKSLLLNSNYLAASYSLECAYISLLERWHFPMLNDVDRNLKFRRAISTAIREGHTSVLDIGSGTGILSLFAVENGACQAYACESSEVLCSICEDVLSANKMKNKIILIPKMSTELSVPLDLPNRMSLVVAEVFDAGLFGEGALMTLKHAWESILLEPHPLDCHVPSGENQGGRVIPESATVWAAPIECSWIRKHNRYTAKKMGSIATPFLISAKKDEPYSSAHLALVPGGYHLLSDAKQLFKVNFNDPQDIEKYLNGCSVKTNVNMTLDGKVDAIAVWFELHVNKELTLSSAPEAKSCWEQAVFPTPDDWNVHVNERLEMDFFCKSHIMLDSICISNVETMSREDRRLVSKSEWIRVFNNEELCAILWSSLSSAVHPGETKVIDLSPVPLGSLFAAHLGASKVSVVDGSTFLDLLDVCNHLDVPTSAIICSSFDELCKQREEWDVLVFDPVEASGLFRPQIIEDVSLLRSSCLKANSQIIPKKVDVFGLLLDSPELLKTARLESDDVVFGFKIAQFINVYQAKLQQDLHFSTLPYHQLCDAISIFEIEFDKPDVRDLLAKTKKTSVTTKCRGNVSALLFWHVVEFSKRRTIDTRDPITLYNQAAFILPRHIPVKPGQITDITCTYDHGTLHFSVDAE